MCHVCCISTGNDLISLDDTHTHTQSWCWCLILDHFSTFADRRLCEIRLNSSSIVSFGSHTHTGGRERVTKPGVIPAMRRLMDEEPPWSWVGETSD